MLTYFEPTDQAHCWLFPKLYKLSAEVTPSNTISSSTTLTILCRCYLKSALLPQTTTTSPQIF